MCYFLKIAEEQARLWVPLPSSGETAAQNDEAHLLLANLICVCSRTHLFDCCIMFPSRVRRAYISRSQISSNLCIQ